jgi:hypothetical protein
MIWLSLFGAIFYSWVKSQMSYSLLCIHTVAIEELFIIDLICSLIA